VSRSFGVLFPLLALLLGCPATPDDDDSVVVDDDDAVDDDDSGGDDDDAVDDDDSADDDDAVENTVGVLLHEDGAWPGYTLFSPMRSTTTWLIDNDGQIVHSWEADVRPGLAVYLLEGGQLLRTGNPGQGPDFPLQAGGAGGQVDLFDWDGSLLFSHQVFGENERQHHDVAALPGSTVLILAWERKTDTEAIAVGRDPQLIDDGDLWPTMLLEVAMSGPAAGQVVWEWHLWDHLIQDFDATLPNYGDPADFPERVDINEMRNAGHDWQHVNSVAYHPGNDEIILSSHHNGEVWIIDHGLSSVDAAGPAGDLLYRWGNPQTYGLGGVADQRLFVQHDAEWIPEGSPGAGNILIFNNGTGRPSGDVSSVLELDSPDNYARAAGQAWDGDVVWEYFGNPPESFYAVRISGAQRLPNGNTLICDGPVGTFFEVTADGDRVWEYLSPVGPGGPVNQGELPLDSQDFLSNSVFRVERYAGDGPELAGRDLTPMGTVEGP
jgi:hypothetical protein